MGPRQRVRSGGMSVHLGRRVVLRRRYEVFSSNLARPSSPGQIFEDLTQSYIPREADSMHTHFVTCAIMHGLKHMMRHKVQLSPRCSCSPANGSVPSPNDSQCWLIPVIETKSTDCDRGSLSAPDKHKPRRAIRAPRPPLADGIWSLW